MYLEALKRLGLSNMINETIHIKQMNLGFSLIDHYIATDPDLYAITGTIVTNASNHFYILATRKKHKQSHEKNKFIGRAYSKVNQDNFVSDVVNNLKLK